MNRHSDQKKALYAYIALLIIVAAYNAFSISVLAYLIPALLLIAPYILQNTLHLRYSLRDAFEGLLASAAILMPAMLILTFTGSSFTLPPVHTLPFQLLVIALPEEAFFRGFLQQRLGNDVRGIIIVSALFAVIHLPRFIVYGDTYSILTFFPSLVMGYLYMRRSNILPSILFHFFANSLFSGISL